MQIIYKHIDELIPYENNPRHNDQAVDAVAASIKEFGFRNPIIIDKNNVIVAGHTRQKAAKQLGLTEVPCVMADDLTDEQIRAFRIADNKTTEIAEWNFDLLRDELAALEDMFTGFDSQEIDDLLAEALEPLEDDYEVELPTEPRAKLGDIYQLGEHRLMCGDSTKAEDVAILMDNKTAALLFTSPPYADIRDYGGDKDLSTENLSGFIAAYQDYAEYQCVNLGIKRHEHEIVRYWDIYISAAEKAGYKLMAWNVWDKLMAGSVGQQSAFFPVRHEWIFVFGTEWKDINLTWEKKPGSINTSRRRVVRQKDGTTKTSTRGDTSQPHKKMESVVHISPELGEIRSQHPATYPVELPAEYIKAMTKVNDITIDPFGGSGTTLIACEQLNRKCYMMELDPAYIDVIIDRWETYTGQEAVKL